MEKIIDNNLQQPVELAYKVKRKNLNTMPQENEEIIVEDNQEETIEETEDNADDAATEEDDTDADSSSEEDDTTKEEEEKPINPDEIEVEVRPTREAKAVEYGDGVDPDDAKTIETIVDQKLADGRKELQDIKDELEVDKYIQANPDFSKYKPAILKYMKHPAYSNIPAKNIAAIVASNDLMKLGAKKERDAQKNADATKTKGSQARKPINSATDWSKAPADAVEAQIRKVKGMQI